MLQKATVPRPRLSELIIYNEYCDVLFAKSMLFDLGFSGVSDNSLTHCARLLRKQFAAINSTGEATNAKIEFVCNWPVAYKSHISNLCFANR